MIEFVPDSWDNEWACMAKIRVPSRSLLILGTVLGVLNCGGNDISAPLPGSLEITTTTSGPEPDPDGYAVTIDDEVETPLGTNAVMERDDVEPGSHSVRLSGMAANCNVAGENPRPVSVASGERAAITFLITCSATRGSLRITSSTTGPSPDPDGYTITVDGSISLALGVTAEVTLDGIAPGPHSVGLTGVADNCRAPEDNPRAVVVAAGSTATLLFSVSCPAPPPSMGSLRITTTTSGPEQDLDGYAVSVDGGAARPIGTQSALTLNNLRSGGHSIQLSGMAANCTAAGTNPRAVDVPSGGTEEVNFNIICAALTGNLTITTISTGSPADPDGYAVRINGDPTQPIGANANLTVSGLMPGTRDVTLSGLAGNCGVVGDNPRRVVIAAGETATLEFSVTCTPATGSLTVTITGLPVGAVAAVTVTGPNEYTQLLTGTGELLNLTPGTYILNAAPITTGGVTYSPNATRQEVSVAAGSPATATITYSIAPTASLNLRVDGLYLTQSTQTYDQAVPLIRGRDGYLRVFVVANEGNTFNPSLRVRFFRDGVLSSTRDVPATTGSVPTSLQEGILGSSWNVPVPGSLVQPGLGVVAEIDPDKAIPESDEGDNTFPASGTPKALEVVPAEPLAIRLVPVRQKANGLQGNVSNTNKDGYLNLARRIYPIPGYDADVHAVYTTTTADELQWDDANGAWGAILSEVDALRVAEGTSRSYYGVVRRDYCCGIAGVGYLGSPTALGFDDDLFADGRIAAHELGHTWGRFHSPCGGPGLIDPNYPYAGGLIGVYGLDVEPLTLRPPSDADIMGYCGDPWISDYTYKGVLEFRSNTGAAAQAPARAQLSLLVWGRIANGQPVLEPAFQLVTRPSPPSRPGPYRLEGHARDGTTLFRISFEANAVADEPRPSSHFAFAVPLDETRAARLETIHLGGPGVSMMITSRSTAQLRVGPVSDSIRARRTSGGVALSWNPQVEPMLLVRDPDTGEVLSFARGGEAVVATDKGQLDIIASDRVRSRHTRLLVDAP